MFATFLPRTVCPLVFCLRRKKEWNVRKHNFVRCFYGRKTWSLTLREIHRLRVFEGNIWTEERWSDRRLEFHNLYSSRSIIRMDRSRRMRWAGHVVSLGKRWIRRILLGKLEGKRTPERPRHRWEYIIKLDLRDIGWGGMDWTDLTQDRDEWSALVNSITSLRAPYDFGSFLSCCSTGGF
jgi:hypothetical protein